MTHEQPVFDAPVGDPSESAAVSATLPEVVRTLPAGSDVRFSHCPLGWVGLLDEAVAALDEHLGAWRALQVKSDMTYLDVYYEPLGETSVAQRTKAAEKLRAISQRATATCEVCGQPGRGRMQNMWLSVLCRDHEALPNDKLPLVELRVADA